MTCPELLFMLEFVILLAIVLASLSVFCYFGKRTDKQFQSIVEREIELLDSRATDLHEMKKVQRDRLPSRLQAYIEDVCGPQSDYKDHVEVEQLGEFRLNTDSEWFPIESVSHALLSEAAFVWRAYLNPGSRFTIFARDRLSDGQGFMLLKPAYSPEIEDRTGAEISTSMVVRYLSEIPWFPAAILFNDSLQWTKDGGMSVGVSSEVNGVEASGVFTFDSEGRIVKFETTERFQETDDGFVQVPWSLDYSDYKELDGVEVPSRVEAAWTLEGKRFPYLRLHITSAQYRAMKTDGDDES
ncbi:hypothetical protein EU546_07020 [Candidatus Thorarchaeota archaeon]|nr:MAG: hypothetical protein EU546_07020 [Candidatus Thorarchaeota archaeon]